MSTEQSRARYPDSRVSVERDGVKLCYEVYGDGERPRSCCCQPGRSSTRGAGRCRSRTSPVTHRVITFDPRGNGRSDRPLAPNAYVEPEFAADALAVLDATGTDRAVVVGFSMGAQRSLLLAAEHPERVAGAVFIGPSVPLRSHCAARRCAIADFNRPRDAYEGWEKYNRHYWLSDYAGFQEFFFSQVFTEPHSTKQREDCVQPGDLTRRRDADRHATRPAYSTPTSCAAAGRTGALPGARHPRRRRTRSDRYEPDSRH